MKKIKTALLALILITFATPFSCNVSFAETNEVPIPNGNEMLNSNTSSNGKQTVDAIVTDNQGNMSEQQLPYNPNNQTVIVNNNYGGDNASLFFPAFELGFMFWAGYWVGHNGSYWNGSHYVHVTNVNWNQHWHNYWNHTWAPKWHNYYNQHHNNSNFKWGNHQNDWHDQAGNWHNRGGRENRERGGERGGGMHGGGHRGGGRR
jgi:uncharacterized membrane protein YgcG